MYLNSHSTKTKTPSNTVFLPENHVSTDCCFLKYSVIEIKTKNKQYFCACAKEHLMKKTWRRQLIRLSTEKSTQAKGIQKGVFHLKTGKESITYATLITQRKRCERERDVEWFQLSRCCCSFPKTMGWAHTQHWSLMGVPQLLPGHTSTARPKQWILRRKVQLELFISSNMYYYTLKCNLLKALVGFYFLSSIWPSSRSSQK